MLDHHKGLAAVYASILLMATNGIFAKGLDLPALDITLYRSWVAALALLILAPLLRVSLRLHGLRDFWIMWGLGTLLVVHWATFFLAMQVSTVAIGMTALFTFPLFTVFIEGLVNRRPIALQDIVLSFCVLVGIYIISPLHLGTSDALAGVGWGVLSAIIFSIRNVAQRHLLSHQAPISIIFYQAGLGTLVLLPFLSVSPGEISLEETGWIVLLGILFTAIPHSLLALALRHLKAKTVAFLSCTQPVLGAAMAAALLNEWPSWNVMLGAAFILGAAAYETMHAGKAMPKEAPAE
ncbi:DMT family transporter [Telmatospirillum sp. J64-1]|uniref:DMT family transporter n=1 Tax=Telmatospirillum sp. J64-1 TaxID=2502183 RepID=UPI00115E0A41|nr:DMT family transporter [Telmatospirillum sp. J64-1]